MALDLSSLPDKPNQSKLDVSALPDQGSAAPVSQPEPFVNRLASGIERATAPLGKAVEAVTGPLVKTAIDITKLPDQVPPLAKPLAEAAVAPVKLGMGALQVANYGMEKLNQAGEYIAEKGGELGVNPNVAAAVGTAISKAPDLYATLTGGGALLKTAGKSAAKKAALVAFNKTRAAEIASMPAQTELVLGDVASATKPVMKLEQLKGAIKERSGEISPKHIGERAKDQMALQREEIAAAGDPAKLAEIKVRQQALREEIIKNKGYTTNEGKFVTTEEAVPLQAEAPPKAIAHELPFASSRSGIEPKPIKVGTKGIELSRKDILDINKKTKAGLQVPEEQLDLLKKMPSKGVPTKPIVPAVPPSPFLPGAESRIKKFGEGAPTDIDKANPLTSRVEFNKRLGDLESTAFEQYKTMGKQANLADEATNKIRIESTPGFKPQTLESETLFNYIESPNKAQFLSELQQIEPKLAQAVQAVEPRVRSAYDNLLEQVNRVRQANGEAPIARRENYVTHFDEMSILDRIGQLNKAGTPEGEALAKEILSSQEAANSAKYARVRDITFRYIRRQMNPDFEKDAVTALERYSRAANRYTHMQPVVNELNASADNLAAKAPNAAAYLKDQADFLAGKVEFVDQAAEKLFGREGVRLVHELSQRAKGNILLGNAGTILKQSQGLLPTVSDNKMSSVARAAKDLLDPDMEDFALTHSNVLEARAADAAARQINSGPVNKQLQSLLSQADYQFAKLAWFSKFHDVMDATKGNLQEALKAAEEFAAMSQGHTSLVNTPPLLRSKLSQELLAFQNQAVANARYITKHLWKGKSVPEASVAALKLGVTFYALQELEEAVLGKKPQGSVTDYIPLVGSMARGMTGPGLSVIIDPLKTRSVESFARAAVRSAFLIQQKVPAGLQVGRQVEKAIFGEKKNGR